MAPNSVFGSYSLIPATKHYTSQPKNMVVDPNSKKKDYHYCSVNVFSSSSLMPFT